MNLASVVRDNARRYGDKPAIFFDDLTLNYAELWRAIEGVAALLVRANVLSGDRVGLSMKEHPAHLIAHYAVARLGAIIVPIDHRWTEAEKQSAASAFATRVVVTDSESIPGVDCVHLDESAFGTSPEALPPIDDNAGDLLISLSSGTTGKPKGALLTHSNLYERFVSQWHAIGYGANDCFAILTPLYFGAGRSFAMCLLAAGGTVKIVPPPLKPPQIVQALSDTRVTATFLPPTLLRRLLELHSDGDDQLLANLDYLVVSGEPLYADEAHECLAKISNNLYSYYASSEGGGISVLRAEDFAEHADTVGKPTYKTDVEIVDADNNRLGAGNVGRLRYRGPGVATRYLDSDGSEQDSGIGGWFYPGDLAEQLASGHIALRGRDKDIIIRGGVNVYPAEIEAVLQQHTSVVEAAVLGRKDGARGEIVTACLVTSGTVSPDEIRQWCSERLAPYKIPENFEFLDSLPKHASGKIDKKSLAAA